MNFEALLIFFIDGLSFIELDPYWNFYIMYRKNRTAGKLNYFVVGYATTYEFRDEINDQFKARISQFLIIPLHQNKGFGTQLLDVDYSKS